MQSTEQTPNASEALSAPLPARWGPGQRLKNTLIYVAVRLALVVAAAIPFSVLRALCARLGRAARLVARSDLRRVHEQLAQAMPQLDAVARERVAVGVFEHLGLCAAELVHLREVLAGPPELALTAEQRRLWDDALAEGKGVVAVSGHIGNWELLPQLLASSGYPIHGIAKPLYDPRLTRLAHRARTQTGMKLLWRGDAGVGKDMLRVFRNKQILALLIDQDTRVQGAFVPFFGRSAYTPTAAAVLALRFGAPIIVGWCHREGHGFTVHFERHRFQPTGDHDRDVRELTLQLTARLEYAITQKPEQWVWLHRRWKTQENPPPAESGVPSE